MKFSLGRLVGILIVRGLIFAGAVSLLTASSATAQTYHQLTIDDFQGMPRYRIAGEIAYINSTIDFKYQAYREQNYYRLDFDIQLILNINKSWMDKGRVTSEAMLAEILRHEQGHYAIAYMEQQELLREVGKTVFQGDYQYEAQNIFDRIDAKYKQLNRNYDADTRHMLNRVQQQSWDAYFKKRLEYMPIADNRSN